MSLAAMIDRLSSFRFVLAIAAGFLLVSAILVAWSWSILDGERFEAGLSGQREVLNRQANRPVGEFGPGASAEQSLLATADGLSAVRIQMVTFLRENNPDVILELSEEKRPDRVIRSVTVPASELEDNLYERFEFEPVEDSDGRRYIARLTSPEGRAGNGFGAWFGDEDYYPDGELSFQGKPIEGGDLVMEVVYSTPASSTGGELLNRLSQYKPGYFKGPALVALAALVVVLSAATYGRFAGGFAEGVRATDEAFSWRWLVFSLVVLVLLLYLWHR